MSMFSRQPSGVDPFSGASGSSGSGCCCTETGSGSCCGCLSFPLRYMVAFSEVSGGTCTNAECDTAFNKVFTLTKMTGICRWANPTNPTPCIGDQVNLYCEAVNTWMLDMSILDNVAVYRWFPEDGVWSCLGENVMNLSPSETSDYCNNWPATVRMIPI